MHVPGTLLALGALLLVLVGLAAALASRRRVIARRPGSFACLWSALPDTAGSRVPGIAQFGHKRLAWFRVLSLSPRPVHSWCRDALETLEREPLDEVDARGRALVRVHCRHEGQVFVLVMSASAYAGLVSWLEAGPRRLQAH